MFDELDKYKHNDHFFFSANDNLAKQCNAPADTGGVYIMNALKAGRIELVYIGSSGKIEENGEMSGKTAPGGLKKSIVNGPPFENTPGLQNQVKRENIEALDIYWYVTHDQQHQDSPQKLKDMLLQKHIDIYGRLPRWNSKA